MEIKFHNVDMYGEAKLHYQKKIKAELIEAVKNTPDFGKGVKKEVLVDLIRILDNQIYEPEETLMKNKKDFRTLLMGMMDGNTVIVTKYNNWFCKRCKKAHGALYISKDKERYCPECVPEELKKGAIKFKQNGDLLE